MNAQAKSDFLHALFVLKSLLGAEFGKGTKHGADSLSMPEYVLLKRAAGASNGAVNLAEVREYLAITKAAVSQLLASLEQRGFLTREADPANRRALLITLPPAGSAVLHRREAELDQRLGAILSRVGESDLSQFTQLILKMNAAVAAAQTSGGSHDNL